MQGNAQLQGVQAIAIARCPTSPDIRSFAHGAIPTAWYVAQNAIKQDRLLHSSRKFAYGSAFIVMVLLSDCAVRDPRIMYNWASRLLPALTVVLTWAIHTSCC